MEIYSSSRDVRRVACWKTLRETVTPTYSANESEPGRIIRPSHNVLMRETDREPIEWTPVDTADTTRLRFVTDWWEQRSGLRMFF